MAPRVADIKNKTTGECTAGRLKKERDRYRVSERDSVKYMLSIRYTRPLPQSAVAVTFCVFVAVNNMSILSGNCGQRQQKGERRQEARRDRSLPHVTGWQHK